MRDKIDINIKTMGIIKGLFPGRMVKKNVVKKAITIRMKLIVDAPIAFSGNSLRAFTVLALINIGIANIINARGNIRENVFIQLRQKLIRIKSDPKNILEKAIVIIL